MKTLIIIALIAGLFFALSPCAAIAKDESTVVFCRDIVEEFIAGGFEVQPSCFAMCVAVTNACDKKELPGNGKKRACEILFEKWLENCGIPDQT